MSDAIMSFIGGWWARWFSRAGGAHAPLAGAPGQLANASAPVVVAVAFSDVGVAPFAETAPAAAQAVAVIEAVEIDEDEVEESFLETVGLEPGSDFTRTPFSAEPRVRDAALAALGRLKQIPALQSLVQGVMRIMGRDGVSVHEVVEALEKDSALCVRLLAMANSVAVSPEQRIEDLQTAVQMLGIAKVRRAAQAVFTLRGAQRMVDGIDWRHLWIHAAGDGRDPRGARPAHQPAAVLPDLHGGPPSRPWEDRPLDDRRGRLPRRHCRLVEWRGPARGPRAREAGVNHREAGVVFARATGSPTSWSR